MATTEQSVAEQKPQKTWFERNWWWVLLLVIVGGGLVCCGVGTGVFFWRFAQCRQSEPYLLTLEAVRSDPVVLERLGKPIEEVGKAWDISITSSSRDEAKVMFPVSGPKGKADVTYEARRTGGKWTLTYVEVDFGGGDKHLLEIKVDKAGGLEEAPPWRPPSKVGPEGMPSGDNP